MRSELTIEPRWLRDEAAVLSVEGVLAIDDAPEIEAALALLELRSPPMLIMDLRGLELIDSSGLRILLEAEARSRAAGRGFAVTAKPGGVVRRMLDLTLLSGRIPVREEPQQALEELLPVP